MIELSAASLRPNAWQAQLGKEVVAIGNEQAAIGESAVSLTQIVKLEWWLAMLCMSRDVRNGKLER